MVLNRKFINGMNIWTSERYKSREKASHSKVFNFDSGEDYISNCWVMTSSCGVVRGYGCPSLLLK
jgi:hypothetical protein